MSPDLHFFLSVLHPFPIKQHNCIISWEFNSKNTCKLIDNASVMSTEAGCVGTYSLNMSYFHIKLCCDDKIYLCMNDYEKQCMAVDSADL